MKKEFSAGGIVWKKTSGVLQVLLVKHSNAGHWGFPKGHIGDNNSRESVQEAALREVREEGGIVAKILNQVPLLSQYMYEHDSELRSKSVQYFLMEYVSGDIKNHDHEVSDIGWYPSGEAVSKLTFPIDKKNLQQALQMYEAQN